MDVNSLRKKAVWSNLTSADIKAGRSGVEPNAREYRGMYISEDNPEGFNSEAEVDQYIQWRDRNLRYTKTIFPSPGFSK